MVKLEKAEQNTEEKREEKPPFEEPSYCLLCGMVGPALLYGATGCVSIARTWYRQKRCPESTRSKRKAAGRLRPSPHYS
mgnify:CR=1 FL=1